MQLFWPSRAWLTIAAWRDDGPAPRVLLSVFVVLLGGVLLWPYLSHEARSQVAAFSPIATPKPSPTVTRTPTAHPAIALSFTLPPHVGLSALTVKAGDRIREGQILARWTQPQATPLPTGTAPPTLPSPIAANAPQIVALTNSGDRSAVVQAQAALAALEHAQPAERAALVAQQSEALRAAERAVADARRALEQLQPFHERAQQEAQHAVDAANVALVDAQGLLMIDDRSDPSATVRLTQSVHDAEAALRSALDAQDRMRTDQGHERQQAEATITQAQADLAALPAQHAAALAQLDARHAAALISARGALAAAQTAADADAQRSHVQQQQAVATMTALQHALNATATAESSTWSELVSATAQAHQASLRATSDARPTPMPDRVLSRASGHIVAISAAEHDGVLIVTLELTNAIPD